MKKIKRKLNEFSSKMTKLQSFFKKKYREKCDNAKITEFRQKNTEKGAKIQKIQRKCQNTEQIF